MRAIAIAIAAIVDDDASPRPDPRLPHPPALRPPAHIALASPRVLHSSLSCLRRTGDVQLL